MATTAIGTGLTDTMAIGDTATTAAIDLIGDTGRAVHIVDGADSRVRLFEQRVG
jgi:hypothetical protein